MIHLPASGLRGDVRAWLTSALAFLVVSWAPILSASPFNPSRLIVAMGTNHPLVQALSWGLALDNDHLAAVGQDRTTNRAVFILKRHLGGPDKWNVAAAFQGLSTDLSTLGTSLAGDILAVSDPYDNRVATSAGAVHILMRNYPRPDAWGLWKTLYPSNTASNGYFGVKMATDGRYLAVASSTTNGTYLYGRNAGGPDAWGLIRTFPRTISNPLYLGRTSVAIADDLLAVGDYGDSTNQVVRVYERNVGGAEQWGLLRTLVPADGQITNFFGASVALKARILAVGAPRATDDDGAVYLFERDQGGASQWGQVARLSSDPGLAGGMGYSIAVDGDTVVASAYLDPGAITSGGGALYVFQRNAGGSNAWGRTAKLVGDAYSNYLGLPGRGVALEGDTVAAGSMWSAGTAGTGGAGAHLFQEYACPTWSLLKKITTDAVETNVAFGSCVVLDEYYLASGRPGASALASNEGGFATFERNLSGLDAWGRRLTGAGQGATNAQSGSAMALSPHLFVIGAPGRDGSGRIEIRDYAIGGGIGYQVFVPAPDLQTGERFGASLAAGDDLVLAGAPLNNAAGASAGAAFLFSRNTGGLNTWGLAKRLNPAPLPEAANFGHATALYRDIAAVGAPFEADLVNGDGAVYLFQANRGGSNEWGQVKRIKVPDAGAAYLGWSVALWGDVLAVGAIGDNDGATGSGAVYLFERNRGGADSWGLLKKIKAPTPQNGAGFGWSVALRGDRLIVGEPDRDADFTDQGRVFVFERNDGGADQWGLVERINMPAPQPGARFGAALAMINDRIAVGVPSEDIGTGTNAGAVYLFQPDCLRITTTNDVVNPSDELTSLREAIALANASTQAMYIVRIPDGTFVSPGTNEFMISNKASQVILQGQGARRTSIDKQAAGRIFRFATGTTGEVRDLTVKNGKAPDGANGVGAANGGTGGNAGGVLSAGNWTFLRCAIVSNAAGQGGNAQIGQGTSVGFGGSGGAFYITAGRLELRDCTLSQNQAGDAGSTGDTPNGGGFGGAIFADASTELSVLNSTFYDNAAGQGSALSVDDGSGGAIRSYGTVTIRHSTISHNRAGSGANRGVGGGLHLDQPATLKFSVINNNTGATNAPDASATFASPAYNLISNSNGVTATGSPVSNIVGVLAQLGASLGNYGGPTDTMLPQPGSPVIDKGDASYGSPLVEDQRGYQRPTNGVSIDLGAVETTSDFDGDGVPDIWEQARGTDAEEFADADADLDGDGYNGLQEYIMDTNPFGSDPLALVQIIQSGTVVSVRFSTSTNRLYTLEAALSPLGLWIPVLSQHIPGNGGVLNLTHTNSAANCGYRVIVELP